MSGDDCKCNALELMRAKAGMRAAERNSARQEVAQLRAQVARLEAERNAAAHARVDAEDKADAIRRELKDEQHRAHSARMERDSVGAILNRLAGVLKAGPGEPLVMVAEARMAVLEQAQTEVERLKREEAESEEMRAVAYEQRDALVSEVAAEKLKVIEAREEADTYRKAYLHVRDQHVCEDCILAPAVVAAEVLL